MRRCLRERALVLLQAGDGTPADRRHLEECAACAARYHRVLDDVQVIHRILEEEPPRIAVARSRRWPGPVWMPVATAALALLLGMNVLFAWQWSRLDRSREPLVVPPQASRAEPAARQATAGPDELSPWPPGPVEGSADHGGLGPGHTFSFGVGIDDLAVAEDLGSLPLGDLDT